MTTTTTPAPRPTTAATADPVQRGVVLVLIARRARRRDPSASVWRLLTYDTDTRTPAGDIASRWEPLGTPPGTGRVPEPVAAWVTAVLGPGHSIGGRAEALAGPESWHITGPHPDQPDHPDRADHADHAGEVRTC